MDEKKLKDEFIKYFGEEKWEEEEILGIISRFAFEICNEYLGIEPLPILFEDLDGEASRLDVKEQCIFLNRKYKDDIIELLHSALHELEHSFQIQYAYEFNTPKALRWRSELESGLKVDDPMNYVLQEIEIDANAFAAVVLECELGIHYEIPNEHIQKLIEVYIASGKILSED